MDLTPFKLVIYAHLSRALAPDCSHLSDRSLNRPPASLSVRRYEERSDHFPSIPSDTDRLPEQGLGFRGKFRSFPLFSHSSIWFAGSRFQEKRIFPLVVVTVPFRGCRSVAHSFARFLLVVQ